MTDEETIQKLMSMRLNTMAQALRDLLAEAPGSQLSFSERVALMVDREWSDRDNRRLARLMRSARLSISDAAMENIWCDPARGIDKAVIRDLATCKWIKNKQNVVVVGKTGVGKTFFAAALAQAACRDGLRALCTRVPRLLHEISIARADGTYAATLGRLAKLDVLVLDDFLIAPLKDQERRDLVEILEDRYGKVSTVVTSQVPTKNWHETLGDPTMADAICDRLVHNAHVIAIRGPSMRQKKGMLADTNQPTA
jgi:DNA replication protein DnaC